VGSTACWLTQSHALAFDLLDSLDGAQSVALLASVVAEVELSKVLRQVVLLDTLVDAFQPSLENAEVALDGVARDQRAALVGARVLLAEVVDGAVRAELVSGLASSL
jgi:hypothetical protein